MSIMRDGRDTAASLFYLEQLNRLREEHLERVLRGETVPPDFWQQGEARVLEQTKREFFNRRLRDLFLAPAQAAALSDDQDFAARSTGLVEMGMLESHRALAKIPWVGHPDFGDQTAPTR